MKIIFLDIDGVLNCWGPDGIIKNCREHKKEPIRPSKYPPIHFSGLFPYGHIDGSKVKLLNGLIQKTGASIVLSSTWREKVGTEFTGDVLYSKGLDYPIMSETPILHTFRRSEISSWLALMVCHVENYVIIDDDPHACIPGHFVQTDSSVGLEQEHVDRAIEILGAGK